MRPEPLNPSFVREIERARVARLGPESAAKVRGSQARRRQRHDGTETESFVNGLHELCLNAGVARMHKIPTPFRVSGRARGGALLCFPEEKSTVDYEGHIIRGPGAYVEAKRLSDPRLNFANRLPEHQRGVLDAAHDEGQVAVLLVIGGASLLAPEIYAIPWIEVRALIDAGEKSLALAEMGAHRVHRGEPYLARWRSTP